MADETKLEITLQGEDMAYLESRLSAEEGETPSSYVAGLIAYDKEYQRLLEERLVRALNSGKSVECPPEALASDEAFTQWLEANSKVKKSSAA
ncbi:hypothetical protein [Terriglobus saanensis]|uniref:Uncharacterized protein n=1 Tax=Terriglobus saanensis (strain ATCC BAA-1853 / DSM 23119 / SP1PR4) TaxID=401053 RepID=E8V667_TERSS|nr:hypothetical protein [Terriglobus saanensis]ADV84958.1 hypothetical protein AciPR4_4213 [Terriglobus saanensis SP1PR4]